jgi:tetratricopeptide (TPR) repeat protein
MLSMKGTASPCSVGFRAIVLSSLLVFAGCGGAASRLASHMDRGRNYFAAGDFTHASIEFRNAMQIAPKDREARLMAARTAEKVGQLREAVGLYQSLIDAAADDVEAAAGLGRILAFVGESERANKVIEPPLAKHPDNVALLMVRAAVRTQLKDEDGARADADQALKLAPGDENAISLRAGLYQRAGDLESGIELVSDGLTRQPQSISLHEVLANLYGQTHQADKAEEQYRILVKLQPTELRYRRSLALFYADSKRFDEAQRTLEEAVAALPKNNDIKLALAQFVAGQRGRAESEKLMRGFIAKDPDNFELRFALAALFEQSGAAKEALDTYAEIIRRDQKGPKGLLARDRIAAIYLLQGRDVDARKLVDEVLRESPRDDGALTARGQLALKSSDPASAVADLRAVLRDHPKSVAIERMLARAYQSNGEPALAEQTLKGAMDGAPDDLSLRVDLAELYSQTERLAPAIAFLEATVRKYPSEVEPREALVRMELANHDYRAARTAAEDIKVLKPGYAQGPFLAGMAAQGENKLEEAQAELEHARALRPQSMDFLTALAHIELARGNAPQALSLVQGECERETTNAGCANLLGELYTATKDMPRAQEAFTRAGTLAPNWWLPYRNLGVTKVAMNDKGGALTAFQAAVRIAPTEPQPVTELARLYENLGRQDDAIALYEGLLQRSPHSQFAANNLAMLLVTHKNDKQSLDRARDLTAGFASSEQGTLLDTNGWVHFKRGEYAAALPVLERAAQRAPEAREIRYHLGMAELRQGQSDKARGSLEFAVSGQTRYSWSDEARSALAGLKDRTG